MGTYPVYGKFEALDLVLVGVDVHGVGRQSLEEFVAQLIDRETGPGDVD